MYYLIPSSHVWYIIYNIAQKFDKSFKSTTNWVNLIFEIRDDFQDYVGVCFKEFGDRVKHWITLNEPFSYSFGGYGIGLTAPGRCSEWQRLNCTGGDSGIEPYLVSHNQLLAHAAAVKLYKDKYQVSGQKPYYHICSCCLHAFRVDNTCLIVAFSLFGPCRSYALLLKFILYSSILS